MTRGIGDCKISRQLFVLNHTTDIRFLVDCSPHISIIPATNEDKKKNPHKFTLQAANKSLIQTFGQRCLTLNLGLKWVFTLSSWLQTWRNPYWVQIFLHKYSLLVDINKRCLTDPLTNVKSFGSVRKGFPLSLAWLTRKRIRHFASFFKKIANIT